jgi:hypothetical protein
MGSRECKMFDSEHGAMPNAHGAVSHISCLPENMSRGIHNVDVANKRSLRTDLVFFILTNHFLQRAQARGLKLCFRKGNFLNLLLQIELIRYLIAFFIGKIKKYL